MAGLAVTTKRLAFFFGVSDRTVERWKVGFPEFCQSIKEGRLHADSLVAEKLFQRATGYEWVEDQAVVCTEITYRDNGMKLREIERVKVVQVIKRLPPDTKAQKYWLKNRRPEHWRERLARMGAGLLRKSKSARFRLSVVHDGAIHIHLSGLANHHGGR
jgi:hypothetical protein